MPYTSGLQVVFVTSSIIRLRQMVQFLAQRKRNEGINCELAEDRNFKDPHASPVMRG